MSRLDSEDLMQKNFLRLNIVFGQRGLETMNSTAAMTWEGLASNIGGTLTLYIGFTVMTFVELVELICRLGRLASISQNQVSEVGLRRPSSHATSVWQTVRYQHSLCHISSPVILVMGSYRWYRWFGLGTSTYKLKTDAETTILRFLDRVSIGVSINSLSSFRIAFVFFKCRMTRYRYDFIVQNIRLQNWHYKVATVVFVLRACCTSVSNIHESSRLWAELHNSVGLPCCKAATSQNRAYGITR